MTSTLNSKHASEPSGAFLASSFSPVLFETMAGSMMRVAEAEFALMQAIFQAQFGVMEAMLRAGIPSSGGQQPPAAARRETDRTAA
ncbi:MULTISPECIES: hypothetical protein [Acidiphilium]|uniref:hypothetical protein n=1 Tax=Acidiphilium TaxID=522 RepID=UPI0002145AE4|nr:MULTISPECIES: hypothetical protein [Acidiphilium]EGO94059.1 hypothetical protein APM_3160 [Acidiphilium sp. PM]KDM68473.1 hypothetical protein ACIDI_4c00730 [Acidiphilium sp. JA12-A1]MBS3023557.1 hypothetical protein [Acidiphilium multivorum]UNC14634.1 hypothetical protein FE249_10585 [Acidiphilium multivorum]